MKWFKVQTNVFPLPWKEVDKVPTNMEWQSCVLCMNDDIPSHSNVGRWSHNEHMAIKVCSMYNDALPWHSKEEDKIKTNMQQQCVVWISLFETLVPYQGYVKHNSLRELICWENYRKGQLLTKLAFLYCGRLWLNMLIKGNVSVYVTILPK